MNRVLLASILLVLALGSLSAPVDAATMYKWVDEKGTVHFGERPPQGVKAEPVSLDSARTQGVQPAAPPPVPANAAAAAEAAGEPTPKSPAQQQREERAEARAKRQEEQRQVALKCKSMRQQLAWVEPSPRVIVATEDGGTRRLDDDERIELVNEARDFLASNDCD